MGTARAAPACVGGQTGGRSVAPAPAGEAAKASAGTNTGASRPQAGRAAPAARRHGGTAFRPLGRSGAVSYTHLAAPMLVGFAPARVDRPAASAVQPGPATGAQYIASTPKRIKTVSYTHLDVYKRQV